MRKLFSPLAPLFLLLLVCAAAQAQPAPRQTEECRRAAARYIHPSPDKKHLTVEQEEQYEYRGMIMYLAVCGSSDDEFTRGIRQVVAAHEAAVLASSLPAAPPGPKSPDAPCDDSVREVLFGRFRANYKGNPEQRMEAYEAAKEYVCRCADYDKPTLYLTKWIDFYTSPRHLHPEGWAAAGEVAREDAQRPRCLCDEMRVKLYDYLNERLQGERLRNERMQQNHETVRKFLDLCGDTTSQPIDRYLNDWLAKYDKAVREFEEKQQKGEAPAKGPAKEQ